MTVPEADWINSTSFELVPGDLLTTYLSMITPPFETGAVMATDAELGEIVVTEEIVGAPGTVSERVEIGAENADKSELPPAYARTFPLAACATLWALTLNRYVVAGLKPLTTTYPLEAPITLVVVVTGNVVIS